MRFTGAWAICKSIAAATQSDTWEDPDGVLLSPEITSRVLALARSNPHVLLATRRREFTGLISNGGRRAAFLGIGVEPQDDAPFSRHTKLVSGKSFSSGDPHLVLAGVGLTRKLGAQPGDDLTLITTLNNGALDAVHSRLEGVFEGGLKEYDDWTIKLPLSDVEHLLNDTRTEQIVLLIDRTEEVADVQAELENDFRRPRGYGNTILARPGAISQSSGRPVWKRVGFHSVNRLRHCYSRNC
jgi:ABC-type lipoprotein release transport system permease subunit